jgi:hypothetical protein
MKGKICCKIRRDRGVADLLATVDEEAYGHLICQSEGDAALVARAVTATGHEETASKQLRD